MAVSAQACEPEVAEQGNIVVASNRGLAAGAMRTGPDDRFVTRQPMDTDVQKVRGIQNTSIISTPDIEKTHGVMCLHF